MKRILTLSCALVLGSIVACTSGGSGGKAANCSGIVPGTYKAKQGSQSAAIQIERDGAKNLVILDESGTVLFTVDGKTKVEGQETHSASCVGGSIKIVATRYNKESTAILSPSGGGIKVELDETPPIAPYILTRVGPPTAKLTPEAAAPAPDASASANSTCVDFEGSYFRADSNEQVHIVKITDNLVSVTPSSHKPALIDDSSNKQGDILILGRCDKGEIDIAYDSNTPAENGYLRYSKTPTGIHEASNFGGEMKEADYVRQ